jgi:hypothetical protein
MRRVVSTILSTAWARAIGAVLATPLILGLAHVTAIYQKPSSSREPACNPVATLLARCSNMLSSCGAECRAEFEEFLL